MKELKNYQTIGHIIETHFPFRRKPGKRYLIAQTRGTNPAQVQRNECVEFSYHEVLNLVKTHHLKPGEVYYEKDLKNDKSQYLAMHSFVTPTFYWRLDCAAYYDFEIEFAFHECPFEDEIRKMFRAFPLDRQTKEKPITHYNLFYKAAMVMLEPEFVFCFKR